MMFQNTKTKKLRDLTWNRNFSQKYANYQLNLGYPGQSIGQPKISDLFGFSWITLHPINIFRQIIRFFEPTR